MTVFFRSLPSALALTSFAIGAGATTANHAPTLSGKSRTQLSTDHHYIFQPVSADADGNVLRFSIKNKPSWASFNPYTGQLQGIPTQPGTYPYVVITVSDGLAAKSLPAFTLKVSKNEPPNIGGTPPRSAKVGNEYSFKPIAWDSNGDTFSFRIKNKPSWAYFDTHTGKLGGTPRMAGTYSNITISATDRKLSRALPAFSIVVANSNSPPSLKGTAPNQVVAGQTYKFQPSASDADKNVLGFKIQNKPYWAKFNTVTGVLSGVPGVADVATYTGIKISVSDGTSSAVLPAFSIAVTTTSPKVKLSWRAPQYNTDGSTLLNLAGYRIHHGRSATRLDNVVWIDNPEILTHTIENLQPGLHYFAMEAYDDRGVRSKLSSIVQTTIR